MIMNVLRERLTSLSLFYLQPQRSSWNMPPAIEKEISPAVYQGERVNSISHLIGSGLAIIGFTVLIVQAIPQHDIWKILGSIIYGVTLLMLYFFSTLYHSSSGKAKALFRIFDHASIYLLIAGTYTPFTLVTLRGLVGWWLFAIVWGLACVGILQDVLFKKRRHVLSVSIYLIMGWLAVAAFRPLASVVPSAAMLLLFSGGFFYTVGVVFYSLGRKLSRSHEIFHFFVLAGSICHYFAILFFVI
jgi:hemolysin III